jgi:hypothetical protein
MVIAASGLEGPVAPTTEAISTLRPLGASSVTVGDGFWGERIRINREVTIEHGYRELVRTGTLQNFRLAAGEKGEYQALGAPIGVIFPFLDSDVYKWLEAVGWELGRGADPSLASLADEAIALVENAQRPDGYINTYVQVIGGGRPFNDLQWGHELYCFGHLIQAAIAWHRALADDRLLAVAIRTADLTEREFGSTGRDMVDGHPEIEMALVELYRVTGERRYLELAARMIELRGRGILGPGRLGAAYWQDHATVREATSVAGHSVRQLYLDCGAVDVATELGDRGLLEAVERRWRDMVATRTYLTGGVGSRHKDEAFGDPYELPPDQAYTETCAAIASVMLSWRLLLATGDAAYADAIERTMLNGVLPGVAMDGTKFFYINPLQRRTERAPEGAHEQAGEGGRASWYPCACCPPNLMRTFSSWEQLLATTDGSGVQLHQYAPASIRTAVGEGVVGLAVQTGYPWMGEVRVTIEESPQEPWALSLRVPAWARSATVRLPSGETRAAPEGQRVVSESRSWRAGDVIGLELEMSPRVTAPHRRVDAIRGCVALERGPLVYCIETVDLPSGTVLEDVSVDAAVEAVQTPRPDLGPAVIGLTVPAERTADDAPAEPISVGAIPYFTWANRAVEAMRVWIPVADRDGRPDSPE